jgi:formylglycine-generating enzyme required for sulfatase activity
MRQYRSAILLVVHAIAVLLPLVGCVRSTDVAATNDADVRPYVTASGIEMIFLPGGTFTMGSDAGNADESPVHQVTVSSFLIDASEVTHEMFTRAELPNPSKWQDRPDKPVERVRWREAKIYCNERSLAEGLQPCYDESRPGMPCDFDADGYRLPTEAEWEYACRAGTSGDYDFGRADQLKRYAVFDENSGRKTHPVRSCRPNRWGIYGMYGNVCEWCQDVYDEEYYGSSPERDPRGPPSDAADAKRVIRGGSWRASAAMCRASFRQGQRTGDTDACFATDYCGFRCVRRMTSDQLGSSTDQTKAATPE